MPQFSSLQQSYHQLLHDLPAFASVVNMQTRCELAAEPGSAHIEKVELRRDIKCTQVSFSYDQGEARVITDLDLLIRAGETTAIVGPSGAGKSTIADLMMGLIAPDFGQVLVDDMPLTAERMQGWRDSVSVTSHRIRFCFTIRSSPPLLWPVPGRDRGRDSPGIAAAALDGVCGRGSARDRDSGWRSRRAIVGRARSKGCWPRALLRKPSLLILDEATSALDSENEQRIQSAIEELHGDMTILLITHRLSTIRNADIIYLIENGSVAEFGTWDQLLAKENGRLRMLSLRQRVDRELELNEALTPR
jgi:ATP-binding cassette subfamily C protein